MPWPPRRRVSFIRRADGSILGVAPPGWDAEADGFLRDPLVRAMYAGMDRERRRRVQLRLGAQGDELELLLDEQERVWAEDERRAVLAFEKARGRRR